ncbi:hypothetical protein BAU15_09685 [Enterococcus sp. JM4C]|uniref:hypothetical protein n=1 Tax=Candidatus Enterococcus huntleyi TaxID=1857217 RepID=UPI001379AAA4|nr:hypothetical protein [Enterococcus sp. JM4C]KAF1298110.1 hypothetical protein BAU15_09685 [Enterococcus sp. JM4C]
MAENEFFETSFRFKWGTGFIIEFLTETIDWANENQVELSAPINLVYALEGEQYAYNTAEGLFEEVEEGQQVGQLTALSTQTNFVMNVSRQLFDELVTIGNKQLTTFKEQLINEFQEENERSEQLHKIYDEMENFDALLTYTDLEIIWQEADVFTVEDPSPQKAQEGQHFIG